MWRKSPRRRHSISSFPSPLRARKKRQPPPALFSSLDDDALLSIGVPADWLADVRAASEDGFFALTAHLPAEASEALLEYAATGRLVAPTPPPPIADPFAHPDALRRIRLIADQEELEQALVYPWEKWGVFLHPSQRALVDRSFSGPARVAGSAGTGKTIVAIHRAVSLARENPNAKVLLASFSEPLAAELAKKVLVLAPDTGGVVPRITTASFQGIAEQMFQLEHGVRPRIAGDAVLRERLRAAAASENLKGFSERFLLSEWTNVIDAWGLTSLDAYSTVQRMGRKSRLGPNQRASLWPVFQAVRDALAAERYTTWANVFTGLAETLAKQPRKPFDHVVIDEAQDLAPAELRFLRGPGAGEGGWPVPVGRRGPAHFPASIFVGEPRRRCARPVAHAQGLLPYLAANPPRRRSAVADGPARHRWARGRAARDHLGLRRSGARGEIPRHRRRGSRRSSPDRRRPGLARGSRPMRSACSSERRSSSLAPAPRSPDLLAPTR